MLNDSFFNIIQTYFTRGEETHSLPLSHPSKNKMKKHLAQRKKTGGFKFAALSREGGRQPGHSPPSRVGPTPAAAGTEWRVKIGRR